VPDSAIPDGVLARILDESEAAFEAVAPPSLSLAIGAGGTVVAERAWGVSHVDRHVAATPETAYLLASVTKPMTATAIALLAIKHGISLDDPISASLGYQMRQVCTGPEPTLADLLGHRAGIGRYCRFFYDDEPARPAADFRLTAENHVVVTTPPGEYYEYSNIGYGVLDEVIAVVSGVSTGEFFQREIFDVLEMHSASIGPSYTGTAAAHAERYGTDGTAYPTYDVEHRGASLAWATTADVVRFGLAHCAGGTFGDLEEIRAQQVPPATGPQVGHAWRISSPGGMRMLRHSGGMGGVSSLLLVCPTQGLVVATAVNESYSTLAGEAAYSAMSRLLSEVAGHDVDALPPTEEPASTPSMSEQPGHWIGESVIEGNHHAVEVQITSAGEVLVGRESDLRPAIPRPLAGHDLRLAVDWSLTGIDDRATNGTCLDLVRTAEGYAGRIAITDLRGAGLTETETGTDGGQRGSREASYVTYPIVLTAMVR
jgi:CubicO group peptidase (beta-lactamase class C family)